MKIVPALALGLLAIACTTDASSTRARTAEKTVPGAPAPTRAGALNDAQILDVLTVVNRGEIEAGKIAKDKAQRQEVKDFADMMIGEHGAAMDKTRDLMTAANLQNQESALSRKLRGDVQTVAQRLQSAATPDFDREYLDAQIRMHQDALRLIDDDLLPAAQNGAIVSFLKELRPKVAMHLDHARDAQRKIGGSGDMSTGR
jgi:putative membrane protein